MKKGFIQFFVFCTLLSTFCKATEDLDVRKKNLLLSHKNASHKHLNETTAHVVSEDTDLPKKDSFLERIDLDIVKQQKQAKALGFIPFLKYWGDFLANPVGGLSQGSSWAQLLKFGGSIPLDPIGWKEGALVISFSDSVGYDLGRKVGNIFTPSQAESFQTLSSDAIYLKQQFFNKKLEVRVGRFSSASVFASLPAMGDLPVSAAVNGTPTSLFTNLSGWHSSGKPSWAAYMKAEPRKDYYIKAGILEVNPEANQTNYHGFDMSITRQDGTLLLTEFGWTPTFHGTTSKVGVTSLLSGEPKPTQLAPKHSVLNSSLTNDDGFPGIYMMGGYVQNYPQTQFNGGTSVEDYGFYMQGQQLIWRNHNHPKENLNLWTGITYAPQTQIAPITIMGYGGIYYQGLLPSRERDIALLNFYTGTLSGPYAQAYFVQGRGLASQETVAEVSYIVQLTDHFQFQPDMQWIIQPGGYASIPNALVLGFQVAAQF